MESDGSMLTRRSLLVGTSVFLAGCLTDDTGGDDSATEDGKSEADGSEPEDGADDESDSGSDDGSGSDNKSDEQPSENDNPAAGELSDMGDISLTSPAFDDGDQIPEKYGYDAENVNPPLEIENVPEAAETLALVMDDPDAVEPAGKVWDHWIVWNIPPGTTTIPEGWEPDAAMEGKNDFGEVGYGGPSPPDTEHRYRFKLFALDTSLDLPTETDAEALGSAMEGHILEQTQFDGTYPA